MNKITWYSFLVNVWDRNQGREDPGKPQASATLHMILVSLKGHQE